MDVFHSQFSDLLYCMLTRKTDARPGVGCSTVDGPAAVALRVCELGELGTHILKLRSLTADTVRV